MSYLEAFHTPSTRSVATVLEVVETKMPERLVGSIPSTRGRVGRQQLEHRTREAGHGQQLELETLGLNCHEFVHGTTIMEIP